ncbi:MAG: hypothetical protein LBR30_04800, partial [Clostridioides sp.]|nr:hypothetical protein [Clostridioides sp.]
MQKTRKNIRKNIKRRRKINKKKLLLTIIVAFVFFSGISFAGYKIIDKFCPITIFGKTSASDDSKKKDATNSTKDKKNDDDSTTKEQATKTLEEVAKEQSDT